MKKYQIILISFLFGVFCCIGQEKEQPKKSIPNNVDTILSITEGNEVVKFSREIFLNNYLNQLKQGLQSDTVASFFYDECLDNVSPSYCYLNSHEKISLRYDLIQQLSIDEIKKILKLGNKALLKKKCTKKNDLMPYSNNSTLDLLLSRKRKKSH